MDGTFGGGDLISASLAIMLGGGTDAELHDKEVTLTTSDVTGSQTAIFEYDPQNEPVSGDPAGPWDGYSLFTIDLSAVKDDIEDLQQQVSDLEDALEEMQECCDEVVDVIHDYDPTYDPHPDPPDPTNPTIPEKIQEIIDDESGYELPIPPIPPVNPGDPDPFPFIGSNKVTDEDLNASITLGCIDYDTQTFQPVVNITYPYQDMAQSAIQLTYINNGVRTTEWYAVSGVTQLWRTDQWQKITSCTVESDGTIKTKLSQYISGYVYDFDGLPITKAEYAGYGDPSHTYKVTNT